jgi:hypothetical protein
MTGLKIKGGHCIRAPADETFVLKLPTDILDPYGFPEGFRNLLLAMFLGFLWPHFWDVRGIVIRPSKNSRRLSL